MSGRKKPYLETVLESIGGGIGGLIGTSILLGTGLGPVGVILGTAAGGVLGVASARSNLLQSNFKAVRQYISVLQNLQNKFNTDVRLARILKNAEAIQTTRKIINQLDQAKIIPKTTSDKKNIKFFIVGNF